MLRRILIYLTLVLAAATTARADSSTVLVFTFENLSVDRSLDWVGEGISELIIARLQPEPGVHVFPREERLAAFEKLSIPESAVLSRATSLKVGWDAGADMMITGSFYGNADDFHIAARLVDMEAGSSIELKADGKLQDVIPLTRTLSWHLLKKIVPGTASPESDYTARPPTPRSAFENYIRALLNPDLQKRVELLQNAVRLHPQYGAALFQLGRTYHLQQDFESSNEWLQKLPQSTPERRQVLFLTALNHFNLGDYARAASTFRQLPQTYDVLLNLGAALSRRDDSAGAIAAWKRAASIEPLSSDAFFDIGYAGFLRGDMQTAEKNLTESLKLRGRDSEALFLLGRTYEMQGKPEESRRLIAQASRLSPRVERWQTQPIPRLERFPWTTTFRSYDEVWTDQRLARRSRGQDLASWLDSIQELVDSYLFGDALREIKSLVRVFPDSPEARSLSDEIERLRNVR